MTLDEALARGMKGEPLTVDEAMSLSETVPTDELCDAADKVRRQWVGDVIDTCSIVNARSGRCAEDCKWCSQSRHHHTGIAEYEYIPREDLLKAVRMNDAVGVKRFSMVTSGRKVPKAQMKHFCDLYRDAAAESPIFLCASMGLLNKEELQMLKDAGVKRYHCNLEASSSYFPQLCSTHTHADKLATIRAARELGMEICCGGIIGMGETMRQRLELAEEAREAGAASIPINILQPIPGTALESTPLIEEDDVIRTVALFRFMAPKVTLRFAGGRARLSQESMRRILRGGMNGALVGDMLTTIGNKIDEDYTMFAETGFKKS
jgi:biotin synthase